jgi:hypothetical protein
LYNFNLSLFNLKNFKVMSKIAKLSTLLFLLVAQMSVAFAGNPTDPSDRTYIGFWLVRQANDEIKQVKFVEMPASVMFEGTENANEPMVRELLGYKALDTFEGAAVEESLFMVMSFDSGETVENTNWADFVKWCYGEWNYYNGNCPGWNQCNKPNVKICKGDGFGYCFPSSWKLTCAGNGNGG